MKRTFFTTLLFLISNFYSTFSQSTLPVLSDDVLKFIPQYDYPNTPITDNDLNLIPATAFFSNAIINGYPFSISPDGNTILINNIGQLRIHPFQNGSPEDEKTILFRFDWSNYKNQNLNFEVEYLAKNSNGDLALTPGIINIEIKSNSIIASLGGDGFGYKVNSKTILNVIGNDTNVDPTTITFPYTPMQGVGTIYNNGKAMSLPNKGEFIIDPVNGNICFTPFPNFTSDFSIYYTASSIDGTPVYNVFNATIFLSKDLFFLNYDTDKYNRNTAKVINVLNNDSNADPSTVILESIVETTSFTGTVTLSSDKKVLTIEHIGSFVVDPINGNISFNPQNGFGGNIGIYYKALRVPGSLINNSTHARLLLSPNFNITYPTIKSENLKYNKDVSTELNVLLNDINTDPTSVILNNSIYPNSILSSDRKTLAVDNIGEFSVNHQQGILHLFLYLDLKV